MLEGPEGVKAERLAELLTQGRGQDINVQLSAREEATVFDAKWTTRSVGPSGRASARRSQTDV